MVRPPCAVCGPPSIARSRMADDPRGPGGAPPAHSHLVDFPEALEALFSRMGELKVVLGPTAAPGVDEIERHLRAGLAARERGDPGAAVAAITRAMDLLAALAGDADAAEGAMMRAMAERFRHALARGALGEAKETAD